MCGIFLCTCGLHNITDELYHRGPDGSTTLRITGYGLTKSILLHFTHLSINSNQKTKSTQPIFKKGVYLIANAEIYNYKKLETIYSREPKLTTSDCEVILDMYLSGCQDISNELDGEFVYIILDMNNLTVLASRDPYGVRPLFVSGNCFASEAKALMGSDPFMPGTVYTYEIAANKHRSMSYLHSLVPNDDTYKVATENIKNILTQAVYDRLMGDSQIGCFLSGGLDSSLVCAIAAKTIPDIHAYTIGMAGSSDIEAAKIVADYLNIQHHVYTYTAEEGINAIVKVIIALETYDVTTIRASIPQYLLSQKIKESGHVRVLLSGEGSDELFGGYQYFKNSPSPSDLAEESNRLVRELYMYDNLRTDRTTAAWGLEVRVPFLDKKLVTYVNSIDPEYRSSSNTKIEKLILRESFVGYLPENILFRPKEAFSDAVSNNRGETGETWKEILATHINTFANDTKVTSINAPTLEAKYYRYIYNMYYPNALIKDYWMPKWIKQKSWDPSATTIDCYKSGNQL